MERLSRGNKRALRAGQKMMLVQSQSYREQYGFNSIFLLPANLYGPGDNFDLESSHVIPALIRKCIEARNTRQPFVEAWGTGNASREFLYVEDCAEGLLRAAALYNESEPVNIGTGREIKISDLLQLIARFARFEGEIRWQSDKPDGQPRRSLDVSLALEKFGFRHAPLSKKACAQQSSGMKPEGCSQPIAPSAKATT